MIRLPRTSLHRIPRIEHGRRASTRGVVIHSTEGGYPGTLSWFKNPNAGGVGAQVLFGRRGEASQLTDLRTKCWHAGPWGNPDKIGFEHEGYANKFTRSDWLAHNSVMLTKSANRAAWICWRFKLGRPARGKNIWSHKDGGQAGGGHHNPGPKFPWDLYMKRAQGAYWRLRLTNGKKWGNKTLLDYK